MKILIGVAVNPTEPQVQPLTDESLAALQWGDHNGDILRFAGDDPAKHKYDNLLAKHNQMRKTVLSGDYDALLTVEADMVIPLDAIEKLAAVESDVVYALYCSRHNGMWLCFPHLEEERAESIMAVPKDAKAAWGKVIPSEGAGFGCTLIHRRVLEAVKFRRLAKSKFADDWPFALDVKAGGFKQAHHLGVVCGHILATGGVMWPDPKEKTLYRVDGNAPSIAPINDLPERATYRALKPLSGARRAYAPGEEVVLNADAAAILLARDWIEVIEEK